MPPSAVTAESFAPLSSPDLLWLVAIGTKFNRCDYCCLSLKNYCLVLCARGSLETCSLPRAPASSTEGMGLKNPLQASLSPHTNCSIVCSSYTETAAQPSCILTSHQASGSHSQLSCWSFPLRAKMTAGILPDSETSNCKTHLYSFGSFDP